MVYRQRTGVSAATQSIITDDPDFSRLIAERIVQAELEAWRNRPLIETTYPYLSVDARYEHVRQGVLIVAGVRADGHREILAVTVADTESEATYHHLFRDLKARGLSRVRLVTSDDHPGLKAAINRHFQDASWQRCHVHFTRDLIKQVGAGRRGELAADLHEVFAATTRDQAIATAEEVAARWESSPPNGRLITRRRDRGLSRLFRLPVGASRPHPHHQRLGAAQRRNQAAHAGGEEFSSTLRHVCGW